MNETKNCVDKSGHFIKCIFFCKFHAIAGPQIVTQVPNNYISKDVFDTISQYMIPKAQLQRCFVSVYVHAVQLLFKSMQTSHFSDYSSIFCFSNFSIFLPYRIFFCFFCFFLLFYQNSYWFIHLNRIWLIHILFFFISPSDRCLVKSFWATQCVSITSSMHEMHSILIFVLFLRPPHVRLCLKRSFGKSANTW